MPTTTFPVEVLTPDGEVFNDEVVQISTRTAVGSIDQVVEDAKGSSKDEERSGEGDGDETQRGEQEEGGEESTS